MFSKWIDLYRGYDEQRYTELCALLIRYDIKRRTQVARPDSRAAAAQLGSGNMPGTPNGRVGFGIYSADTAKDVDRTEAMDKLYVIRIRARDSARVRELVRNLDGD